MTTAQNLIVMGPGGSDYPGERGDMLEAPILTSKTDKFVYRRNVRMWYECVQSASESGYTKATGTWRNLGHALFSRMDQRYKRIIHSAIDSGTLRLRTHLDGRKFDDHDHIECVENILNIVAKETTTDRVKRLIRMTKEVHDCRRAKKESFAEYAVRFEGLARAYLSIAKARSDSQGEQNFAIIAIENANLPIATYNAVISNLVSHAKENRRVPMTQIPVSMIRDLTKDMNEMHGKIATFEAQPQDPASIATTMQDVKSISSSLKTKINDIPMPLQRLGDDADEYSISLTKALEELQDIKTEDQRTTESECKDESNGKPKTETQNADQSKQVGTMMGGRDDFRKPKGKTRRDRSQYNQNRSSRRRHQERRKQASKNKRYRSDGPNEDEDSSSDEEYEKPRNKRQSVFERLGKQDDSPRSRKKVRFDQRDEKEDNGDSDTDSYFRKEDRRRS